jgi:hypothetical protein
MDMSVTGFRDIDRRIAVARGWVVGSEWPWVGSYRTPATEWLPLPRHEDAAVALLRELVDAAEPPEFIYMLADKRSGTRLVGRGLMPPAVGALAEAETLEAAIALAWLAMFEQVPA